MATKKDWIAWHDQYERKGSPLRRRLAVVQRRIHDALDAQPSGPIRVISMCAGQGRDLLGVLPAHARRDDVRARLVELDEHNAELAEFAARHAGLDGVEVVCGDASLTDAYARAVPASLVLACGVFGNISNDDVAATVAHLPHLCAPGATVIWTRHRRPPDVTPTVRAWFADAGFDEVAFDAPPGTFFGIGTHRLRVEPQPFVPGVRLFTFTR